MDEKELTGWGPMNLYIILGLYPEYEYNAEMDCFINKKGYKINVEESEKDYISVIKPTGEEIKLKKCKTILEDIKKL